jgi:hypothetical protein
MKQGEKETRYWLLAAWLILATLVMVARLDNRCPAGTPGTLQMRAVK